MQAQHKFDEALKHYDTAATLLRTTTTPSYIDDLRTAKMSVEKKSAGFQEETDIMRVWQGFAGQDASNGTERSNSDEIANSGEHRIIQGYDFPVLSGELAVVLTHMSWIQFHRHNSQISGTLVEEAVQLHATGHHKAIVQYWLGMICLGKAKQEAGGAENIWLSQSAQTDAPSENLAVPSSVSPSPANVCADAGRSDTDLASLKVVDLRKMLKSHGLDAKGRKAELVGRLAEHYFEQEADTPTETGHPPTDKNLQQGCIDLSASPSVAKACEHLTASFQLCKRTADPTVLRNVCVSLAYLQGISNPLQTAYYLHVGLGVSARQEMAIRRCNTVSDGHQPSIANTSSAAQLYSFINASSGEEFEREYLQRLPENLTVCSISYQKSENALLISRVSNSSAMPPLVQRVQLPEVTPWIPPTDTKNDARCAMQLALEELDVIIAKSNDVIATSQGIRATEDDNERVKKMHEWWSSREALDQRMGTLVEQLENTVLGPWKTLLLGHHKNLSTQDEMAKEAVLFAKDLACAVQSITAADFEPSTGMCERLLDGLASGLLTDEQRDQALSDICGCRVLQNNPEVLHRVIENICTRTERLADLVAKDTQARSATVDGKESSDPIETPPSFSLTPAAPTPCKAKPSGKRAFVRQPKSKRTHTSSSQPTPSSRLTTHSTMHLHSIASRQPMCLVLDQDLRGLPWESTPILSRQPVCRMPSIAFVCDRANHGPADDSQATGKKDEATRAAGSSSCQILDEDNTYYVLNPSKDLAKTQAKFEAEFRAQSQWKGVIGEAPKSEQFKEALTSHDIVVYCGHGAGQKILNASQLSLSACNAVMLLMGCSSGSLHSNGEFEPSGMALKYLLAGAPAVVANLWDVTDGDIDNVTKTILKVGHKNGLLVVGHVPFF